MVKMPKQPDTWRDITRVGYAVPVLSVIPQDMPSEYAFMLAELLEI